MAVALRGNLKDFGIAEVFQLIGQQRKTGVLDLEGSGQRVELRFENGAVVSAAPVGKKPDAALGEMLVRCGVLTRERVDQLHRASEASAQSFAQVAEARGGLGASQLAEIDDLLTRETIFAIMRWSSGSFDFTARPVSHERSRSLLGAEQILMDGLRMVDEWHSFAEFVPSGSVVFERTGSFEEYRENASGEVRRRLSAAERVYQLIDGRLSARRIIDLSRLGTFDGTRILADLHRAGVIAPLSAAAARKLERSQRVARIDRARVGVGLAAAFPMILLLLVAAVAHRPPAGGDLVSGIPIEASALEAATESHAARRVRHALEAYRFTRGHWPRDLSELRVEGLLDNHALAFAAGRPYYYAHRDGAVVLLAPER